MIDDLLISHQLTGAPYRQIMDLLGTPQSALDSSLQASYEIDVDYGKDIDPVYIKTLYLQFDSDTIVKKFEVKEWRK